MTNGSFGCGSEMTEKGIDAKHLDEQGRAGHYGFAWHARTRQADGRQADGVERTRFGHRGGAEDSCVASLRDTARSTALVAG